MTPIGGSGGGYFYGPFISTQRFGLFETITPGLAPNTYGAWVHEAVPVATGRGRWLELVVWGEVYGGIYNVQIGLGAAGSEVLFQPSDGNGFYIDWQYDTPDKNLWNVPFRVSFPTSVGIGNEFSIRCSNDTGLNFPLSALIYLWN